MAWEMPYDSELEGHDRSPVCIVSVGEARDLMHSVTAGDIDLWRRLLKLEHWGGHWYRTMLEIACSSRPNEDLVNATPLYVEERLRHSDLSDTSEIRLARTALQDILGFEGTLEFVSESLGNHKYAAYWDYDGTIAHLKRQVTTE